MTTYSGDPKAGTWQRWQADLQAQDTCPPSAVHDMILPWSEVRDGDLVLWHGELRTVDWILPLADHPDLRAFHLDGDFTTIGVAGEDLTAVKRYDTGFEN